MDNRLPAQVLPVGRRCVGEGLADSIRDRLRPIRGDGRENRREGKSTVFREDQHVAAIAEETAIAKRRCNVERADLGKARRVIGVDTAVKGNLAFGGDEDKVVFRAIPTVDCPGIHGDEAPAFEEFLPQRELYQRPADSSDVEVVRGEAVTAEEPQSLLKPVDVAELFRGHAGQGGGGGRVEGGPARTVVQGRLILPVDEVEECSCGGGEVDVRASAIG